ncbi:MAG: ABC transporter ATP-binding protein [Candidatus Aminicenantes bacterium]|nr:ABC transporter ATP-binding protein [Candidatus Aminicenantes bacterium]
MANTLYIKKLTVTFSTYKGPLRVVDNISFNCSRGETISILGESGCGKSVIARAIMRILDSKARIEGQIQLGTLDILKLSEKEMEKLRGNRLSIIVQNPDSALNPVLSIENQLIEVLLLHTRIEKQEAKKQVILMLDSMGFEESNSLLKMYPHQLSGGMRQRLLISATLLTRPEIIIADEPTKGLDRTTRELIIDEMKRVKNQYQSGLLLITHDTQVAREMGDWLAVMYAGEIIEISETQRFFREPLHPYSRALLNSSPERGFQPIPGTSPSLDQLPSGCRFHPRCHYRLKHCASQNPEMKTMDQEKVKCHLY